MHIINVFIRTRVQPLNRRWGTNLEESMLRHTKKKYERAVNDCPEPKVPKSICSPVLSWLDIDEEELARQLCLLDFVDYSAIRPVELLGLAWSKPHKRHRSPNVLRAILRFNIVSMWAGQQIMNESKLRERARAMTKIMRLAKCLANLNNFSSTLALISAINEASLSRLRVTREEVPGAVMQQFKALEVTLSADRSHRAYREHLKSTNPPCVPYLGVYLTDLTFMEDNKDFFANGHINFVKRQLVSRVIGEIMLYQQKGYDFYPVPQIQVFFSLPDLTPEEMRQALKQTNDQNYAKSLALEPRGCDRNQILRNQ
eukprot:c16327_g1_i2.p1 GENE.c16327_g1_i2~~c16327_g1_i2.p1  ORF type:complete len:314 (+),score=47.62 c16327_g1_i2:463-1404(+)